jgi:hypothetical protein
MPSPESPDPSISSEPPPPKRPVWPWLLLVAGLAAMLGSAVIGVSWLRENARRANCKQTLRAIGLCCHIYSDDNDGEFPQNWQQLYPNYVDERILSCPSRPCVFVRDFVSGTATERSSSYILLPGRWSELPGDFFLIYEKPANHQGPQGRGFHVVDAADRVQWWPAADADKFFAELKAQEAQLPELRKKRGK